MEDDKEPDKPLGSPEPLETRGRKNTSGIPFKSGTKEYAREYYKQNKETLRERSREYQRAHPERMRKSAQKYRDNHPDRVKESQKSYRDSVQGEHKELREKSETEKPRFEDVFGEGSGDDT